MKFVYLNGSRPGPTQVRKCAQRTYISVLKFKTRSRAKIK